MATLESASLPIEPFGKTNQIEVEISPNHVLVFGCKVHRPSHIAISQWYRMWENVEAMNVP